MWPRLRAFEGPGEPTTYDSDKFAVVFNTEWSVRNR